MKDLIVSVHTLAYYLDLSSRRIQQLSALGIIKKSGRGKYNLIPCIRSYIKYLKELVALYSGYYRDSETGVIDQDFDPETFANINLEKPKKKKVRKND